jgi:hypothetical protein
MVRGRVIEVDGLLHQAQAQALYVEINVGLRLAGNGCDVVQA